MQAFQHSDRVAVVAGVNAAFAPSLVPPTVSVNRPFAGDVEAEDVVLDPLAVALAVGVAEPGAGVRKRWCGWRRGGGGSRRVCADCQVAGDPSKRQKENRSGLWNHEEQVRARWWFRGRDVVGFHRGLWRECDLHAEKPGRIAALGHRGAILGGVGSGIACRGIRDAKRGPDDQIGG